MKKILFIAKQRRLTSENPDDWNYIYSKCSATGLYNSIINIIKMFHKKPKHAEVKFVQVIDNNGINKEVHLFNPDIVIIEALWVVPEKFDILQKLHPNVDWIVRLHSNSPFLSNEGIAMGWIAEYIRRGVMVAVNNKKMKNELEKIFKTKIYYLPNYYDF